MKIVALLQARTDSSRLPKKVLKNILEKPMIIHQLERTKKSDLIDELILVTSDQSSDDELYNIVISHAYKVYRGDKDNVLKRFYECLKELNLDEKDVVVRLTGDCPLHDSKIIDEAINSFLNNDCDYLANCVKPIYPDGLDVEVFSYYAIKYAYENASKKSELEHVTPYIRDSGKFKVVNLEKEDYYSNIRLTVDEQKDFDLVENIYKYFNKTIFSLDDIINYLKINTELLNINKDIKRNEGYEKSLKEDK